VTAAVCYVLKVAAVMVAVTVISLVVAAICAIIDGIATVNGAEGDRSHEDWH
jgi:hypothetical protein